MPNPPARILIISERRQRPIVPMSYFYEYEDVICQIDSAEIVAPPTGPLGGGRLWGTAQRLGNRVWPARRPRPVQLAQDYDLLLVICPYLQHRLDVLDAVAGWQDRCRFKVLLIHELWRVQLARAPGWVKRQAQAFDHILVGLRGATAAAAAFFGQPCTVSDCGVDMMTFPPRQIDAARPIDVLNIGRRNEDVHAALLSWAERTGRWYDYDTTSGCKMPDHVAHRRRLAGNIRRCKYFVAHLARFDDIRQRGDQEEIAMRHFEGAAAGTVLIGQPPAGLTGDHHFGWRDAIIPVAADSREIVDVIESLERDPARVAAIRRENVRQCLLHHDWSYRWRQVLQLAGLEPTDAHLAREQALHDRAEQLAE